MNSYRLCATFFLLVALFLSANAVRAMESRQEDPGTIVHVRVYTDRAEITRRIERQFSSGPGTFVVRGLPASLIPDSVRISQVGGLPAKLSILNAERNFDAEFSSPAIQKQEEIIYELQETLNAESDVQSVLKRQLRALDSIIANDNASLRSRNDESINFNALWADQAIDFIARRGVEITGKLRQSKRRIAELEKKLTAEKNKLADLQKGAKKQTWKLSGQGQFEGEGQRGFELTYQTHQAHWNPAYIVRAETKGKQVTLEYYGEITQTSGEDWEDVVLELSTGNPQLGGSPPRLFPWIVDYYQERPIRLRSSMEEKSLSDGVSAQTFMQAMPVQTSQGGHALLYSLKGKHRIATGSNKMRAEISQEKFEAHLNYLTIPQKSDQVYLTSDWVNSGLYEYLPGKVWKYLDGDFVGTDHLKSAVPKEKMEISLGVDPRIIVERTLIKKEGGDGGLFDSKNRQHYIYEIKLENLNSEEKTVEVQDQIPLSYQEDIVVKVNRLEPAPDQRDNENLLNWKMVLSPKEKRNIVLDFQVEYPGDKKVSGL